ncbi:MAG: ribonuclease [Bacteroidota bacterium]|jgi:ribonuclease-3
MLTFLKKLFKLNRFSKNKFRCKNIYEHLQLYPLSSEENYIRALTHSSFTKKKEDKNERLEFLGDAVINFCVAESLYALMGKKDEGILTKARASVVNRKNLNRIGVEIGIPEYLQHKLSAKQLSEAPDIIGNAFEALMGAYYLDYGMRDMKVLIKKLLLEEFDATNFDKKISDSKSYLIEWAQSQKKHVTFSHHAHTNGETTFSVELKINGETTATGSGKNKKEAEQDACSNAIKVLELDA